MKPKRGQPADRMEKAHLARLHTLGCLVCGRRPVTVHHVTGYADRMGRFTRSHRLTVPLCAIHHQKVADPIDKDAVSVEGLGHRGFYRKHGIDLREVAMKLWEESYALLGP